MSHITRFDILQSVTDAIIAQLEQGGLPPWKCPWSKGDRQHMPFNWLTRANYSGVNVLLLWQRAMKLGYFHNAWLTYNQALQLGGHVRRGEKAVQCVFVKPIPVNDKGQPDDDAATKTWLCYKPFYLFNLEQVEGLPDLPPEPSQPDYDDQVTVDKINQLASVYCQQTGLNIRHGGDRAYYSPALDLIRLPTTFFDGTRYAATLAHELIHSSGHPKRLDRFNEQASAFSDFDEAYAFEELVAEIGAAMTCAELSIPAQHGHHASYIQSWLKRLKSDKTFIFKAASAASLAQSFLMNGGLSDHLVSNAA